MSEYLKLSEAGQRLGVSEKTARRYVKQGVLPSVFVGGAYRVSPEDVDAFLESARVSSKVPAPSPTEQPSFNDVLEDERRSSENLAVRFKYQNRLLREWLDRWEREIEDVEANRFVPREGFGNDMAVKSLFALSHAFDKNGGKNMADLERVLDDIRAGKVVDPDLRDAAEDLQETAVRLSNLGPRAIAVERRQPTQATVPEESTSSNVFLLKDIQKRKERLRRREAG